MEISVSNELIGCACLYLKKEIDLKMLTYKVWDFCGKFKTQFSDFRLETEAKVKVLVQKLSTAESGNTWIVDDIQQLWVQNSLLLGEPSFDWLRSIHIIKDKLLDSKCIMMKANLTQKQPP